MSNSTPKGCAMGRRSHLSQLTKRRTSNNTVFLYRNFIMLFGILGIFTTPLSVSLVHGFGGVSSSSSLLSSSVSNADPKHVPHRLLRLASWNLLSPSYCIPAKYPWCDPGHLEWDYRKALIVQQLVSFQADILCLQEVQVDLFSDLMASLQLHGNYTGVLQNVTGEHLVGCAIVIRNTNSSSVPALEVVRVESRSRALLAVLKQQQPPQQPPTLSSSSSPKGHSSAKEKKEDTSPFLYLCNVHLEAGRTHEDDLVRYHQLKSLFKRLKYQCQQDGISSIEGTDAPPIVLAGDFNMMHNNPLHTSLSQGWLEQPIKKKGRDNNVKVTRVTPTTAAATTTATTAATTTATNNIRTNNKVQKRASVRFPMAIAKLRDAYLCGGMPPSSFSSPPPVLSDSGDSMTVTSSPNNPESQAQQEQQQPQPPQLQQQSQKPPRQSAPKLTRPQLAMTYSSGSVLDYIWASEAVEIHDALILHPHAVTSQPRKWPSYNYPSDHVPIGIDLEWGTVRRNSRLETS